LYAVSDLTELVCMDLTESGEKDLVAYICDRSREKFVKGYKGYQVEGTEKLVEDYALGTVKHIIICSALHETKIYEDLLKKGIAPEDMISLSSIVFDYEI